MVKPVRILIQMLILMIPSFLSAQTVNSLIDLHRGAETVKPFKLDNSGQILQIVSAQLAAVPLTRLPQEVMKHHPQLLGIHDFDGDGREELFVGWIPETRKDLTHIQIYRVSSMQDATFVREIQLEGAPAWIEFPLVPDGRRINAAVAVVLGGAKWGVYYLILPGVESPVKLGDAAKVELGDLDGDGSYEWILPQWRGFDLRCSYGFFGQGNSMDIYRLSGEKLINIWPPSDWAVLDGGIESQIRFGTPQSGFNAEGTAVSPLSKSIPWEKTYPVMNEFYDVDGDGRIEIIAITDVVSARNPGRRLSVFKSGKDHFDRLAHLDLSSNYSPVAIMGIRRLKDRKQVVLLLADVNRCGNDEHKYEEGVMMAAGYDYRDGQLKQSWVNDEIDINFWGVVKDTDNDGEEEMIFTERGPSLNTPAKRGPLLLKGVKNFSTCASSN